MRRLNFTAIDDCTSSTPAYKNLSMKQTVGHLMESFRLMIFRLKLMWAINSASHNDRFVETINPTTDCTFCKMLPSFYFLSIALIFGDMIFDNYPLKMSWLVWVRKNGTIEGMFDILWHQLSILTENWKFQIQPVIYCSIKSGDMG